MSSTIIKNVEIFVYPEHIATFIEATKKNAMATRNEPGNLRFEIHQSVTDPTLFFLWEAYVDQGAIESHKATAHYATWRTIAEPLMRSPRKSLDCKIIFSDQLKS